MFLVMHPEPKALPMSIVASDSASTVFVGAFFVVAFFVGSESVIGEPLEHTSAFDVPDVVAAAPRTNASFAAPSTRPWCARNGDKPQTVDDPWRFCRQSARAPRRRLRL